MYKRVFMGGTTKGTSWRDDLTAAGVAEGISAEAFFNPTISKNLDHPVLAGYKQGDGYPAEWAAYEQGVKNDPETIDLFDLCPGEKTYPGLSYAETVAKNEVVGMTTIWEIPWSIQDKPGGVAVLFSYSLFQSASIRNRFHNMALSLKQRFNGLPPYFEDRPTMWRWVFDQLPHYCICCNCGQRSMFMTGSRFKGQPVTEHEYKSLVHCSECTKPTDVSQLIGYINTNQAAA